MKKRWYKVRWEIQKNLKSGKVKTVKQDCTYVQMPSKYAAKQFTEGFLYSVGMVKENQTLVVHEPEALVGSVTKIGMPV